MTCKGKAAIVTGAAWKNRANVTPQDIAEGVAMLCSDAGAFICGAELPFMFH